MKRATLAIYLALTFNVSTTSTVAHAGSVVLTQHNLTAPTLTRRPTSKMLDYIVQWSSVKGATNYELQEQVDSGRWVDIHDGMINDMEFIRPIIANYNYRVRACNNDNQCSAWSFVLTTMRSKNTYVFNKGLRRP